MVICLHIIIQIQVTNNLDITILSSSNEIGVKFIFKVLVIE